MSNPKNYTANDIQRYHRGEMTAAEMHQLEKAALDDPMLADALEGYRFSHAATAELGNLQSRFDQRIREHEQRPRVVWLQPWMRIAAMVLLVAGGGWIVWQTVSPADSNLVTSRPASNDKKENFENRIADSVATVLQEAPQGFATDTSGTKDIAVRKQKAQPTLPQGKPEATVAPVTTMNEPVADAVTMLKADSNPETKLNEVAVSRAERMRAAAPPAPVRNQADSLPERQALAKRKMSNDSGRNAAMAAEGAAGTRAAADSVAQPDGGWKAFEEYIAKNQKPALPVNKNQALPGTVELVFGIDSKGRPVNIVVTNSINKESDGEAIRLLKEGPGWKGKRGRVRIPFTR